MRILFSFAILIVLVAGLILYTYNANSQMEEKAEELINKQLKLVMLSQEVAASVTVRAAASTNYIVTGQDSYLDIFKTYSENASKNNELLFALDEATAKQRQEAVEDAEKWRQDIEEQVFAVQQAGNTTLAIENLKKLNDQATVVRKQYDALADESASNIELLGEDVIYTTGMSKSIGLLVGLAILVVAILVAFFTARSIARPIKQVTNQMTHIADGDLTMEPIQTNRKDEIGLLMKSVEIMGIQMKTILKSIHEVSERVASNSEELAQSASDVNQSTLQIAHTMKELSIGVEGQTKRTTTLADTVNEFKTDVQYMTATGQEMITSTEKMKLMTTNSVDLMQNSLKQMSIIQMIMDQSVTKVSNLKNQSQQINQLVTVIKEIANQTNLLALNAAIEAARAGEHGKGFSVVADEVRKLAEQVQYSIGDISQIVLDIQQQTNEVTHSLQQGYEEVQRGTQHIGKTNTTFNTLIDAINEVSTNIEMVNEVIVNFATNTDVINHTIQEVAALSEETTMAVHETSSTVEQTASTVNEIARNNEVLAKTAEQLNEEINHFKL